MATKIKYKRVLLKLSGEAFKNLKGDSPIDAEMLLDFAKRIKSLKKTGVELAIVLGGGNIWRYRDNKQLSLHRVTSDTIGMLSTLMNAMAFKSALESVGVECEAYTRLQCDKALPFYKVSDALKSLKAKKVIIIAGGTGNPFFTTDSAAALGSAELSCDALLKATTVDYVYDKDPRKFKDAKKYEKVSFKEVMEKNLEVMDQSAFAICHENKVPILVFNLNQKASLEKAVKGDKIGTIIS